MNASDVARLRLHHQRLASRPFSRPEEAVSWLGAVQAQDYAGAKWALALRTQGLAEADLDRAFAEGRLLRTHVLRPTWHFVTPADIRWMLALTAERVHAAAAFQRRKLGLDERLLDRCHGVLKQALRGRALGRDALVEAFADAGIAVKRGEDPHLAHILMHAELEGLVCSGGLAGKQHTWALLDERAPATKPFSRGKALIQLARRYFTSHGPATVKDFAWWSGLTVADAKEGVAGADLVETVVDEIPCYSGALDDVADDRRAYLLPNYDEYVVAYADRTAILGEVPANLLDGRGNVLFNHSLVLGGRVAGIWKRTLKAKRVVVEVTPFRPLKKAEWSRAEVAAQAYGAFLGLAAELKKP